MIQVVCIVAGLAIVAVATCLFVKWPRTCPRCERRPVKLGFEVCVRCRLRATRHRLRPKKPAESDDEPDNDPM